MISHLTPQGDHIPSGEKILKNNGLNKGTGFTPAERRALNIDGLLPPVVHTIEEQVARVMDNLRKKPSDIEKYIFLMGLRSRNLTLFYRVLVDHIEEMMPLIYTPTVGQACLEYSHIFRKPEGIFLSTTQKGRFREILQQWPEKDIQVIVITDGERILGLGDLGASGMGIPVGKLSLYTACGGIEPRHCLPVLLDIGTNNVKFLNDPLYIGLKQERLRGPDYDDLVEEFIQAAEEIYPDALIQFEDFGNLNAFRLLKKYRNRCRTFNDDIQGTACVALAGLFSAMRMLDCKLSDQTVLFLGAGEAGTGIGELIVTAMMEEGLSQAEALRRCWFVDSKGLVVKGRTHLPDHKVPFAHDHAPVPEIFSAVEALHPNVLIGVSGQTGAFNKNVLQLMAHHNPRPIVFALSNPTSKAECTAEEAYTWTEGRVVFSSGSPFDPVTVAGKTFKPSQINNAYIFPGIGLGVIASRAERITDAMFLLASKVLAEQVAPFDFECGRLFPSLSSIRRISLKIAVAVARLAFETGVARADPVADLEPFIQALMYDPHYKTYV